jgi:hypothetical protein
VGGALDFLLEGKYLSQTASINASGGKGRRVLSMGESTRNLFTSISSEEVLLPHAELIDSLLDMRPRWDEVEGKKKAVGLKSSEVLLAAVLYSLADSSGEVKDIGFADLRAFTGLNKVQVRGQIKTLMHHGVILNFTPGVMSRAGLEKKKSTFLLNIDRNIRHPKVGIRYRSAVVEELRRAILLAHAMKALDEVSMQGEHWMLIAKIYRVEDKFVNHVMHCVDVLSNIREVWGRSFSNLCRELCSTVTDLIVERKSIGAAEEAILKLYPIKMITKYTRSNNGGRRAFVFFLREVITALIAEIRLNGLEESSVLFSEFSLKWILNSDLELRFKLQDDGIENE